MLPAANPLVRRALPAVATVAIAVVLTAMTVLAVRGLLAVNVMQCFMQGATLDPPRAASLGPAATAGSALPVAPAKPGRPR